MEPMSKLMQLVKLPLRYMWVIAISSGALLFSPGWLIARMGLTKPVGEYRAWISGAFLLAIASIIVGTVCQISGSITRFSRRKTAKKHLLERLSRLSPDEKSVIREFFMLEKNTLKMPLDNPTVAGLLSEGILVPASRFGQGSSVGILSSVSLGSFARQSISPGDIDLPEKPWSDDDIEFLCANRPPFAGDVARINELFGE